MKKKFRHWPSRLDAVSLVKRTKHTLGAYNTNGSFLLLTCIVWEQICTTVHGDSISMLGIPKLKAKHLRVKKLKFELIFT